jgi:hypothetical protein
MIGRSFGHVGSEINLNDFSRILREGGSYEWTRDGRVKQRFRIEAIDQGAFAGPEVMQEREFITCLAQIRTEIEKGRPFLDRRGNEVRIEKEVIPITDRLPFWVFSNEIIFTSARTARQFLLPYFNDELKLNVSIHGYDVEKIYNEKKQIACGFGFMNRPESIGSGAIYGDIDLTDPLVQELDDSEKNFVCLTLMVDHEPTSFNVYKSGTVVIKKNWFEMAPNVNNLRRIRAFLEPYEINLG